MSALGAVMVTRLFHMSLVCPEWIFVLCRRIAREGRQSRWAWYPHFRKAEWVKWVTDFVFVDHLSTSQYFFIAYNFRHAGEAVHKNIGLGKSVLTTLCCAMVVFNAHHYTKHFLPQFLVVGNQNMRLGFLLCVPQVADKVTSRACRWLWVISTPGPVGLKTLAFISYWSENTLSS